MDIVIVIALVLLFVGGCIAAVVFAVRHHGWRAVVSYAVFAIIGRVIVHFGMSHSNEAEKNIIPLIAAGALMWLWPHILSAKDAERASEMESEVGESEEQDSERSEV